MNLANFTLFMTEACNFDCSYCYQDKGEKNIDVSTAKNAIDFFSPFFSDKCQISFYGGEPLLEFDKIKQTVKYIHIQNRKKGLKKQIKYTISTNGSLLNDSILTFMNRYKFSLLVSFDGYAQEVLRKKGSFKTIVSILKKIQKYPGIDLTINSVFTPETVGYLSKSIQFIMDMGVQEIMFSLSIISPWDPPSMLQLKKELKLLKESLIDIYKRTGNIPAADFRKDTKKGIRSCPAGDRGMALTPDGKVWGCHLFADYFKGKEGKGDYHKYCFGELDSFKKKHEMIYPEIMANYSKLGMDYFYTSDKLCINCEDLKECWVCPTYTAFSGLIMGKIPSYVCEIRKILRKEKKGFWEELEKNER